MPKPYKVRKATRVSAKYTINVLISIDQLLNTIACGDPDETISSRLGKIKRANGGVIPKRKLLSFIIDSGLEMLQPGHCLGAIEEDEGKDELAKSS